MIVTGALYDDYPKYKRTGIFLLSNVLYFPLKAIIPSFLKNVTKIKKYKIIMIMDSIYTLYFIIFGGTLYYPETESP
jgi:hypothetical protein